MALFKNSSSTTTTNVKVEDTEPEEIHEQHDCSPYSSLDSTPQVSGIAGSSSSISFPKHITRTPSDAASPYLKKVIVDRHGHDWKDDHRETNNATGSGKQPSDYLPQRKTVVPAKESSVKLWRTPTGKLVKLDARPYLDRQSPRHALGGIVSSQPKFIRLANGKLAKISTKRVLTSRASTVSSNSSNTQFKLDSGKLGGPSATAKITACSGPIDICTLMGNGASIPRNPSPMDIEQSSKPIKTEPMEIEEVGVQHELQHSGNNSDHQQTQKPSLVAALNGVTAVPQVGDLRNLVNQPLFSDEVHANLSAKSCSVCRTTVPAMRKNLLSLEARLGALVDTVQNLLIYLNPKDRRTLELTSTPGNLLLSNGNVKGTEVPISTSTCATTATASYRIIDPTSGSEKQSSYLLPVGIKADTLLEANEIPLNDGRELSKNTRIVRSGLSSSKVPLKKQSISTPRYISIVRGTRVVVADRAKALRTVYSSSGASKTTRNEEMGPFEQRAQLTIKLDEDKKPSSCSFSSGAS